MFKNNVFDKMDIVYNISKKINRTIPTRLLSDIIDLINEFAYNEISLNKIFSVNKFGTFYQAARKPRLVWSNFHQKQVMSHPRTQIKFSPHIIFTKLLKNKRKNIIEILKSEKDSLDKKKRSERLT